MAKKISKWSRHLLEGFFFFSVTAWLPAAEKAGKLCRDFCSNSGFDLLFYIRNKRNVLVGVHTTSKIFENATLFLMSILIRHENGVFRKHSVTIIIWFPSDRVFLKMTGECCVFKFLWISLDRTHLMCFQCETDVSKSLRPCVDGALALVSAASALC